MELLRHKKSLRELYQRCIQLRELGLRLRHCSRKVEGISVNASIVASQTGNQMRTFAEMSAQIEKTSQKMARVIDVALERVSDINRACLKAVVISKRYEKFAEAIPQITHPGNFALVSRGMAALESDFKQAVFFICRGAKQLENALKDFEKLDQRLFLCLTAIRVEGDLLGESPDSTSTESLILSLEAVLEEITLRYDEFREGTSHFKKRYAIASNQGGRVEKRSAA